MNILIDKLSELLNVPSDKIHYIYPELRRQYVTYRVTNLMSWLVIILTIVFGAILFIRGNYKEDTLNEQIKDSQDVQKSIQLKKERNQAITNYKKQVLYVVIVGFITFILSMIIPYFYATDLLLIKELS